MIDGDSGEMAPLGSGFDASANQATRGLRQELGHRVALSLHVLMRHARSYDENNAVFAPPVAQLLGAIAGLIKTDTAFELRLSSDGVRVNKQVIKLDVAARLLLQAVQHELELRGVCGLSAAAPPNEQDIRALVAWLRGGRPGIALGDEQRPFRALRLLLDRAVDQRGSASDSTAQRLSRAYAASALFAGRTIEQLRTGGEVAPAWAAAHLVLELVDLQAQAPRAFLFLARAKAEGDAYWMHHAANVAVLAITLGARMRLDRRRRHDLGMAALFHDVGMAAMPQLLIGKPTALDDRERMTMDANPLFAARVLLRDREVHASALERALAAYECHLDLEPLTPVDGQEIGFCGRVVAICEAFDALTSERPYRQALEPAAAFAAMGDQLGYRFDKRLLELFGLAAQPLIA